jgi:hypothetical protein
VAPVCACCPSRDGDATGRGAASDGFRLAVGAEANSFSGINDLGAARQDKQGCGQQRLQ